MACCRDFEGYYSEIQDDTIDEYFFSSSRKHKRYYGVIIRIFREKEVLQEDCEKIVFQNNALTIVRTNYTGKNPEPFLDHIRYLNIERGVLLFEDLTDEDEYHYDGWGTYYYTAIELKIYLKHAQEKVGSISSPELNAAILEQIETPRLKYHSGGYMSFCVKEHISMDIENTRKYISWFLCFYLRENVGMVLDLQASLENSYDYSNIDFDTFFRYFPMKAVAKHKSMTIYNPRISEKEAEIYVAKGDGRLELITLSKEFLAGFEGQFPSETIEKEFARDTKLRILKIETYIVKTPHWWYLYEIENPETDDTIKYALAKLRKNGYVYHF